MSLLRFFNLSEPKTREDYHDCTLEVDGIEDEFSITFEWYSWATAPMQREIFITDFNFESVLKHDRALAEYEVKDAIRNWFWNEFGATITFEV